MKKIILTVFIVAVSGLMAGCEFATVPPTAKGKVLTTSGYSPDVLPPGKYTLWGRDSMVILQTNTNTFKESVKVVLADKLTLSVDIRFRGRIAGTDNVISAMFNDIVPDDNGVVSFSSVYGVYGRMLVRNKAREIVSQYSVEDVHKNYSRLSKEIGVVLTEALSNTPLEISDITLGDIAYPQVVTQAINAAKERELAIAKEQAQAEIELTKKKNERLLAEADYQIKITNARSVRDSNKIIGEGVTSSLLKLRALEVQEEMAKNGAAVFMPYEAMATNGAQVRMFQK